MVFFVRAEIDQRSNHVLMMSQIHETSPMSIRKLQNLAKKLISDHYYTRRDIINAVSLLIPLCKNSLEGLKDFLVTNRVRLKQLQNSIRFLHAMIIIDNDKK